jgi:hypothetical protein
MPARGRELMNVSVQWRNKYESEMLKGRMTAEFHGVISAPLALWTRRRTSNPKIAGSSPAGGVLCFEGVLPHRRICLYFPKQRLRLRVLYTFSRNDVYV